MSIASEITRLQNAKSALKTAIEGKGVTVPSSAKLEDYPALVDSIQAGGNGDDNWYGVYTNNRQPTSYWFVKETSEVWEMPNPYPTFINHADGLYFLYKGEKYYATAITDSVNALLSKNGSPIDVMMGTLSTARIVKQNGNYYAYFETD